MAYGMTPGHGAWWDQHRLLDATVRRAKAERQMEKLVDRANHFDTKARWMDRLGRIGKRDYYLRQRDKFNAEAVSIKLGLAGAL